MDMEYSILVDFYQKIEETKSRIAMTDLLVALFKKTPREVVYLTQGKLRPDYEGIELGIAEKLTMRALAMALGLSIKDIERES